MNEVNTNKSMVTHTFHDYLLMKSNYVISYILKYNKNKPNALS